MFMALKLLEIRPPATAGCVNYHDLTMHGQAIVGVSNDEVYCFHLNLRTVLQSCRIPVAVSLHH